MTQYADHFPIETMTAVLGVSKSGYYQFLKAQPSLRYQVNQYLIGKIKKIHQASHETYGSPRIHAELREMGESCSRQRVARLMKAEKIMVKMSKKFKKRLRNQENLHFVGEDLIQQDFSADEPNVAWVSDITYVWTQQGWIYCAIILDLFSRRIVGLSIDVTMTATLVLKFLQQALTHRKPPAGIVHHSDRGSQYTSKALKMLADNYGVQISMGRIANAYDNAVAESFFHTLKMELVYFCSYKNFEEAKMSIFQYIYGFYNQRRKHSTLGYVSPAQFERNFNINKKIPLRSVH
ncbi:MAG: IS3 family transposase [Pseudomonadota bacterium]|jgi:putative transposase